MSNFVVSARKYRPQRFDEVVGQQHVSQTLKNALQNNHLAHAFLFCGPRGVGKTTCARILAKVLNCENVSTDHEPCDTCGSCTSFNKNASFNITELDAASNNSVEHIRALIEQVRFQPQQGQYKVFIIDEVHMLSQQAFNAFLKTLEEPPPYAIFILATTEKHKIIPTILSRCQIFDFKRIQIADTVRHLEGICTAENIKADKEALHIIAQKADGALRDALSIFDRMVSSSSEIIRYEDVIENLNVLDYDYFFKIVDSLLIEDMSSVLLTFDDVLRKGFDADLFINGLAEHIRNVLVCQDAATLQLLEGGDRLRARYKKQAEQSPAALLLSALSIANKCDIDYKMTQNKRLHVEMALIKMCHIQKAISGTPTKIVVEKKNADKQSIVKQTTPVTTEKVATSQAPEKEKKVEEPIAKLEKSINKSTLSSSLSTKKEFKSPSLASLDKLDALVEKSDGSEEEDQPITIKDIEKAWIAYQEKVTSQSVANHLKRAKLKLEGQTLLVTVASNMSKSTVQNEFDLMQFIREQLNIKRLGLEIIIDESLAPKETKPQAPKKALTDKEKFEQMVSVNPLLAQLQAKFGLQPDTKH